MSKQKKQHGGDWIDKLQAHNRNVYLERQAEQAKLDRQQNEEHRRQLREIEQKKADDEAARLQLAREERAQQDRAKHENERIYNLARRLKELKNAETMGKRFLLICELQKEAQSIDLNAVLDLAYKDRFSETEDAIDAALSDLYAECGDNAVYLKAYAAVMKNPPKIISSLSEIDIFSRILEAEKLFPELLTANASKYTELVNNFQQCASKAKSIFEILKAKSPEQCHDKLKKAIAAKTGVPESIFSEKGYDLLETVSTENENLIFIKEAMLGIILDDSIPSEAMQPLFDFLAERSSTEKIVVETYRRDKALEKIVLDIAKMKEQKELNEMRSVCKAITSPEIMLKFDTPDEDDVESVVAKAWHKTLGTIHTEIIFYRDHVCWLSENKASFSASWDDLVNSWERDYKKGGGFSLPEFRGHKILDVRCVELFEKLIAYKRGIADQQEKAAMPPRDVPASDKEASASLAEKNGSHGDFMALFSKIHDVRILIVPNIPQKKLCNALESYARGINPEDVIVLIDDTVWGNAKNGMIVTSKKLFCKEILQSPVEVTLSAETKVSIVNSREIHIDGRKFCSLVTPSKKSLLMLAEAIQEMCKS